MAHNSLVEAHITTVLTAASGLKVTFKGTLENMNHKVLEIFDAPTQDIYNILNDSVGNSPVYPRVHTPRPPNWKRARPLRSRRLKKCINGHSLLNETQKISVKIPFNF
jgi:hypothetical protein